jgi:hypothetical protein
MFASSQKGVTQLARLERTSIPNEVNQRHILLLATSFQEVATRPRTRRRLDLARADDESKSK